jgi:hypothetical protein
MAQKWHVQSVGRRDQSKWRGLYEEQHKHQQVRRAQQHKTRDLSSSGLEQEHPTHLEPVQAMHPISKWK